MIKVYTSLTGACEYPEANAVEPTSFMDGVGYGIEVVTRSEQEDVEDKTIAGFAPGFWAYYEIL